MSATPPLETAEGVSLPRLRTLIGVEVAALTDTGTIEGVLLSCTTRSAWIVAGEADHVVALAHLVAIRQR